MLVHWAIFVSILDQSHDLSFQASPIELWFSAFKSDEINKEDLKTGKKSFKEVARFCHDRVRQMKDHTFPLFWRNFIQHLYGYLVY